MPRAKSTGPQWFKLPISVLATFLILPDEAVGKGLKAAMNHFSTGQPPGDMEILAQVVYTALLPYMEEANRSYEKTVAAALKGAQARWGTPPSALAPGMPRDAAGIPSHAGGIKKIPEEEAEEETEADQKKNESIRPFRPPTAAEVHRECVQKGYRNIDPERFVSYYASTGWRRGTTPITDWRSALHAWSLQKAPAPKGSGGLDRLAQLYKEDNL